MMTVTAVVTCVLRRVEYQAFPAEQTITVRCTAVADTAVAHGYGTAVTEAVARRKALSEAVERMLACTPFALLARPSTSRATAADARSGPDGARTVPPGCRLRRYRALDGGSDLAVPLFWSAPWVAGTELAEGALTPPVARLSSTIGWAVAPTPAAALRGAVLELTELLDHGAFLYRSLAVAPAGRSGTAATDRAEVETIPLSFVGGTPVVLVVARAGRRMPATGLGAAQTVAAATERALLELAQADTMWRANETAVPAERYFLRRFERWPLLLRCATLDFEPVPAPVPGRAPEAPERELAAAGVRVWADTGELEVSAPELPTTRLHFAHAVSRPQPLLGLVRAGVPVFDMGEVRKILDDRVRRQRPLDRRPAGRGTTR